MLSRWLVVVPTVLLIFSVSQNAVAEVGGNSFSFSPTTVSAGELVTIRARGSQPPRLSDIQSIFIGQQPFNRHRVPSKDKSILQIRIPASAKSGPLRILTRNNRQFNLGRLTIRELSPASLSFEPSSILFGNVRVGESSIQQTVKLINRGEKRATALYFNSLTPSFVISSNSCSDSLDPKAICNLELQFNPSQEGPSSASLQALYKDSSNRQVSSATLSGLGIPALKPANLVFGNSKLFKFESARLGETRKKTFTLRNTGEKRARNISISVASPFLISNNPCPEFLEPNATCTFEVSFKPAQVGSFSGAIQAAFLDDRADSIPQITSREVEGVALPELLPANLVLTDDSPGTPFQSHLEEPEQKKRFSIKNVGEKRANNISFSPLSAPFSVSQKPCPDFLDPDSTCTFEVGFKPLLVGVSSGSLKIFYQNSLRDQTTELSLSGLGLEAKKAFWESITPSEGEVEAPVNVKGKGLHFIEEIIFVCGRERLTTSISAKTETSLTFLVPGSASGVCQVQARLEGKTQFDNAEDFLVLPPLRSFSFYPDSALPGQKVYLTGESMSRVTKVTFGGVEATDFTLDQVFIPGRGRSLNVIVPMGAQSGPIRVSSGGRGIASDTKFFVQKLASFTFTPSQVETGQPLTISGTGLKLGTAVKVLEGAEELQILSTSFDSVTVVSPRRRNYEGPLKIILDDSQELISETPPVILFPWFNEVARFGKPGDKILIEGNDFEVAEGVFFWKQGQFSIQADFVKTSLGLEVTVPPLPPSALEIPGEKYGSIAIRTQAGVPYHAGTFWFRIPLVVHSFFPLTGKAGDLITITGSGFSQLEADLWGITINYGGAPFRIKTRTDTELGVVVPPYSWSGNFVVGNVRSEQVFTPTDSFESSEGLIFDPPTGSPGDHIVISGKTFDDTAHVFFSVTDFSLPHSTRAKIISQSLDKLTVEVPECAETGIIAVHLGPRRGTWPSPKPFEVINAQLCEKMEATHILPIEFSGTPSELGTQQGNQLGRGIYQMIEEWVKPILASDGQLGASLKDIAKQLGENLPPEAIEEMKAMAQMSEQSLEDILMGNVMNDSLTIAGIRNSCSTFVVMPSRSRSGAMVFGRNLDFLQSDILRKMWLPVIYRKTGKLAVLSLSVPGLIGVASGINEKGVAISHNTSYKSDEPPTPAGIASLFIIRKVLEEARTAREAVTLYQQHTRTTSGNITITDGNEAFVLEEAPVSSRVRIPYNHVLFAVNHFVDPAMKNEMGIEDERWRIFYHYIPIEETAENYKIGLGDVRNLIEQTGIPDINVLGFVLDYKSKRLYFGSNPEKALKGDLKFVNLVDFLKP